MRVDSFKVVLVGESSVGKTSIITKFIDETFLEDQQTTKGTTFNIKMMNKKMRIDKKGKTKRNRISSFIDSK